MTARRRTIVRSRTPLLPSFVTASHCFLSDIQALLAGKLLASLGVTLIGSAKLITGGVVGLAFLLHYTTGIGFGELFLLINPPLYLLAIRTMGRAFLVSAHFHPL